MKSILDFYAKEKLFYEKLLRYLLFLHVLRQNIFMYITIYSSMFLILIFQIAANPTQQLITIKRNALFGITIRLILMKSLKNTTSKKYLIKLTINFRKKFQTYMHAFSMSIAVSILNFFFRIEFVLERTIYLNLFYPLHFC